VFKFVGKLPERRRRIYELAAIGCSYSDIAHELGTTENAIKTTMGQIKGKLKTCMT
jgi:DNA-binding NarL/FixJ family response regulator